MKEEVSVIVAGDAGLGVESAGSELALVGSRSGVHVLATPDARSRIRGGHNFYRVRLANREVDAHAVNAELLVALTPDSVAAHLEEICAGGGVVYPDGMQVDEAAIRERELIPMPLPLRQVAEENGSRLMVSTGAVAAAAALVGLPLGRVQEVVHRTFARKGERVVEGNSSVAETIYRRTRQQYVGLFRSQISVQEGASDRVLMNGNQAFAIGALVGGCRFISAYPMTPATSIFEELCALSDEYDIVTKHTEDEIAAVCMAVGAAFTGARAMTATSGGGFCLMVEALGLAGMTEVPLVVVNAQRGGPSTGLPTRTEQADLLFAVHTGHGEFPRIILAPGSVEECFEMGWRSFNLADQYQCPVIVLTDTLLATTQKTVQAAALDFAAVSIDRGATVDEGMIHGNGYQRFALTATGVSPRAFPGDPAAVFSAPSDEHDEGGHITEDAADRVSMMDKRMLKLKTAEWEMRGPQILGPPDADVTLVCWGSTTGVCLEAARILADSGTSANVLKFGDLWPLPTERALPLLQSARRPIVVEQNYTGQLRDLVRMATGFDIPRAVNRYDGRPMLAEDLAGAILERVNV